MWGSRLQQGVSLRLGPPPRRLLAHLLQHPSLLCPRFLQLFLGRPFCSGPSWISHFLPPPPKKGSVWCSKELREEAVGKLGTLMGLEGTEIN